MDVHELEDTTFFFLATTTVIMVFQRASAMSGIYID